MSFRIPHLEAYPDLMLVLPSHSGMRIPHGQVLPGIALVSASICKTTKNSDNAGQGSRSSTTDKQVLPKKGEELEFGIKSHRALTPAPHNEPRTQVTSLPSMTSVWPQISLFWLYQSLSFCQDPTGLIIRSEPSRGWHPQPSPARSPSWAEDPLYYVGRTGFQNCAPLPCLWEVWAGWGRCSVFWQICSGRHLSQNHLWYSSGNISKVTRD